MLTLSDLVHIPYTDDLTQAGTLYASRCLALDLVQASNQDLTSLRCLSAEVAADLSLKRYFAQEHISYKVLEAEPFTHPDRNEIILGGRPCHVINAWIARKAHIHRIKDNPAVLLPAPACVPEATITSEKWGYQDLLIFTFTLAVPTPARQASSNAKVEENKDYLIFVLPESWRNVRSEGTISGLVMQSASDGEIALELGGQTIHHDFLSQNLQVSRRQPAMVIQGFTRLVYIATRQKIIATISIHNPKYNRALHITPDRWGSLGLDGDEILLAGYIEVGEFRRRAHRFRPSARLGEFGYNPSASLSISLQDLLPLPQLVAWLRSIQESS